ncbi:macro domain-containing protein [Kineosporia sp. R_H_3]|uniref:macro domain-containing protein n=1 Tax=Kineosporia sp. R_H_3 TaxID=1961848 RepID=UPI001304573F|nr:macro domain-containing protein [Kineosporia sp. R_H_3]
MKLRTVVGDLAGQPADAVVRVVPPPRRRRTPDDELGLLRAAGPQALAAFEELLALSHPAGLPAGQAVSTTAGTLPARWLVHVAAPQYDLRIDREHLLSAAYRSVLAVADALGARTLALTPIGMTQPYWPLDVATRVALTTLPNTPTRVREATLVVRTPAALDVVASALAR